MDYYIVDYAADLDPTLALRGVYSMDPNQDPDPDQPDPIDEPFTLRDRVIVLLTIVAIVELAIIALLSFFLMNDRVALLNQ